MILIGLGANVPSKAGSPAQTLAAALEEMEKRGLMVMHASAPLTYAAWPDPEDPPFENAVAAVETALPPAEVLSILLDIEREFGRVRGEKNAPRTLDLDLLAYDDIVMNRKGLTLPHPRMAERRFVLEPLCRIAPHWLHPVTQQSAEELLAELGEGSAAHDRLAA